MKSTKIMLACIAIFILTWMSFGLIEYLLSDLSYKECMTHRAVLTLMLIFGWIPAVIIGYDLDKTIEE